MGMPVFILGQTGTGKSYSMVNFKPEEVALIQVIKQPMPFKGAFKNVYVSDNWECIKRGIKAAVKSGFKIIVIDDFQYLMSNEFMYRASEKGFDKFNDIAFHAWSVINAAIDTPDDCRVYILSHTSEDEMGNIKAKTIGKMLDDKITLEGMFTIVLRTVKIQGEYFFKVQNNGFDTVKSPMGMFEGDKIENDLAMVDAVIVDYYK